MKYHKPLWPTTPLPQFQLDDIKAMDISVMKSDFAPLDEINIIAAKQELINRLQTFWMTTQKVGRDKSWFVSGGCIGSLLRNEKPKDIDVYFFSFVDISPVFNLFTEDESYMKEVAVVDEKYRDVVVNQNGLCITENAITLKNDIQIITKHYGYPADVRKTFDFVHCMPYFDSRDQKLYISKHQYDLCVNKKLEINSIEAFTKYREQKFLNKGWEYVT